MARLMSSTVLAAAATLAPLLIAVAAATAAASSITMVVEEENLSQCRQQIEHSQKLHSCQQYLVQGSRSVLVPEPNQEDGGGGGGGWREQFQRCCEQLEQMDEQCRCKGIRTAVQQQRQRGELHGLEMREMLQTAESLPPLCRMGPSHCDVPQLVWF